MADKFEIYKDKKGEYRWKRTSKNGERVGASTEGYTSKASCERNMERNKTANPKDKWEFYTDKKGGHRWRRTAVNGRLIGASTQGYAKPADCKANAKKHGYKK